MGRFLGAIVRQKWTFSELFEVTCGGFLANFLYIPFQSLSNTVRGDVVYIGYDLIHFYHWKSSVVLEDVQGLDKVSVSF